MHTNRTAWRIAILVTVVLALASVSAAQHISLHVSPVTSMEPADIRIEVLVPRDALNRAVRVEASSGAFFSSSEHQLDGQDSAALNEFTFAALPAGTYEVSALVLDASGRVRSVARDRIIVMPRGR